jgi:muramoyltetrapeptide carboxypeptidase LdcA involved in peptidoglycan recycling
MRSLGERGLLAAVDAVIVARPPTEDMDRGRTAAERRVHRAEQRDTAIEIAHGYNPDAVVCVGPPFGHTRPQWIIPYGGTMTVDGTRRRIWADYT